jgi:hypothetical protein
MSLSFLPNLLCILRMLLVWPLAVVIFQGRYELVLAIFALAAFTDALDGFLAKRFDWTSELGKHLDPLADKLLLVTMFVCLSTIGLVPWWLTGFVLLRDLIIVFGALTYRALFGPLHGKPDGGQQVEHPHPDQLQPGRRRRCCLPVAAAVDRDCARCPGVRLDLHQRHRLHPDLHAPRRRRRAFPHGEHALSCRRCGNCHCT